MFDKPLNIMFLAAFMDFVGRSFMPEDLSFGNLFMCFIICDLRTTHVIYRFLYCRLYIVIVFGNLLGKILSYSSKVGIENVGHYHLFSDFFFLVFD